MTTKNAGEMTRVFASKMGYISRRPTGSTLMLKLPKIPKYILLNMKVFWRALFNSPYHWALNTS